MRRLSMMGLKRYAIDTIHTSNPKTRFFITVLLLSLSINFRMDVVVVVAIVVGFVIIIVIDVVFCCFSCCCNDCKTESN